MEQFSPKIEYYSIDEFFFLAVRLPGMTYQQTAETIRDRMLEATGLPVTVGIAKTQTLAKLISDSAKPFGAKALFEDDAVAELLKSQAVTEIAGIAGRRAQRLEPWGIRTCFELAQADRRLVREVLTSSGEELWWELNGERVKTIHTQRVRHKTLSRGGSFGESTASPSILWGWLIRNLERLIEELEFHKLCAGKITVWVAYRNGMTGMGHTTLPAPSQRFDVLLEVLRPCLRKAWIPKVAATRMHLIAENLVPRSQVQLGYSSDPITNGRQLPRSNAPSTSGTVGLFSGAQPPWRCWGSITIPPTVTTSATSEINRASNLMCMGISLARSSLPTELIGRHHLDRRFHERGGEVEIHFYFRSRRPCLPIWRGGQFQIVPWGNRLGRSRFLPKTGWTWQESLEEGMWKNVKTEFVDIPANLGFDRGV